MTHQSPPLTATNIKYLLAMQALDISGEGMRCVDVAQRLGITKPSVHTMMKTLIDMKLVEKPRYGTVCFTVQGKKLTEQYCRYYKTICIHFEKMMLTRADGKAAACALLAEMPPKSIASMCACMEQSAKQSDAATEIGSGAKALPVNGGGI